MGSHVDVELAGQKEFKIRLDAYERDFIHDLEKIVKRNTTRTVTAGKREAPEESGTLKRRIRQRDVSSLLRLPGSLARTVASRAPHRHLVELGTGMRTNRHGFSRGRMPANPFMARAETSVAPQYGTELRQRIQRRVEI